MKRVLFVCSQNLLRSPTAEQVFANYPGIECTSAGLAKDTHNPVTDDLVDWADIIFVMEKVHRRKLTAKFGKRLKTQRVICLDIPDDYEFMDPALIELLNKKVPPFLPRPMSASPSKARAASARSKPRSASSARSSRNRRA